MRKTLSNSFYPLASLLLLVLSVVGFQLFYFYGKAYPGRDLTPPIKEIIIFHSLVMSVWLLLAVIQPFLIYKMKYQMHRKLGFLGAVIAILVFVTGVLLAIQATKFAPPQMTAYGFNSRQFIVVPLSAVCAFAVFVVLGIKFRTQPNLHKPMMFLASLTAVSAAIARIDFFNRLYMGTFLETLMGAFPIAIILGVFILAIKTVIDRALDKPLAYGLLGLSTYFWLVTVGARTSTWDNVVAELIRLVS